MSSIREGKRKMQRQIITGGAGEWIIKNGKFYDPVTDSWILKCVNCKKPFYAGRLDARTCGDKCRQAWRRKQASYEDQS